MSSYLVKPGKAKIGPKAPIRRREPDTEETPSQSQHVSTAITPSAPPERATPLVPVAQNIESDLPQTHPTPASSTLVTTNADQTPDEAPVANPRKRKAACLLRQPAKPRRKKEPPPEDAEEHQVEPGETRMEDLTRDTGLGRKSTRQKRLEERDEQEKEAKRAAARSELATTISVLDDDEDSDEDDIRSTIEDDTTNQDNPKGVSSTALVPVPDPTPAPPTPSRNRFAPQVRVVNGVIVHDDASRFVDRQALAQANEASQFAETRVEDELTRRVNQGNYLKQGPRTKWTDEDNSLFWDGLRMFGTDFDQIKMLFRPHRTHKQIKLKFNKEERENGGYVTHVLIHERKVPSLEVVEELAGVKFKKVEDYTEELEQDKLELERLAAVQQAAVVAT